MSTANTSNKIDYLNLFLGLIGLVFIVAILSKLFKNIQENNNSELISEEGKKILADPDKRKKLREAVDYYHEHGNWDKLEEINN